MINKLKQLLDSGKFCEIYANPDNPEKFLVGYIVNMDDDFCLIVCIDFYGKYDGIVCLAHEQIFKVQTDTRYLNAIEVLMEYRKEFDFIINYSGSILQSLMQEIEEKQRVCQIELFDSDDGRMFGTIDSIDLQSGIVKFASLDEYGIIDGESYVDMSAISLIEVDSCDARRIEKLRTRGTVVES